MRQRMSSLPDWMKKLQLFKRKVRNLSYFSIFSLPPGESKTDLPLVAALKEQRKLQATAILSSRTSHAILKRLRKTTTAKQPPSTPAVPSSTSSTSVQTGDIPDDSNPLQHATLLATTKKQALHNQECTYRACASITTFRIRDPDPHAVDQGNVLGIRIDVGSSGKFIRPYYIMLNRPYPARTRCAYIATRSRLVSPSRH